MDLQSFLQSGLLESYVLGQCTPDECALVERMIREHPAARAELEAIEASLEKYAMAHAVTPSDGVKAAIMDRIQAESRGKTEKQTPSPKSNTGNLRLFQVITFLLAAAVAFLFLRQKDLNEQNIQYQLKIDNLNQQVAEQQQQIAKPDPLLELLCDAETRRLVISDGKGIYTLVYYNPRLHRMAYDPSGLPVSQNEKYYQFWAIVDGAPVSLGMKATSICGSLVTVEKPTAFAVSEENSPNGNDAPTRVLALVQIAG